MVIAQNQKFAFIALAAQLRSGLASVVSLGSGVWATTKLPVGLDGEWKRWIGSIRTETLEDHCNLFLCAAMDSRSPGVLDQENHALMVTLTRLIEALPLTGNVQIVGTPILVSGAMRDDGLGIRHLGDLTPPRIPGGVDFDELDQSMLSNAFRLSELRRSFEQTLKWDRVVRIFHIWSKALREQNTHERLHQFCRCVEGFIMAEVTRTRSQFMSRGGLFAVGRDSTDKLGRLYDMRSKTEHMHEYEFSTGVSERDKRLEVMRMAALAQALATYCVGQLVGNPALWPHFSDAIALAAFWQLDHAQRRALWGKPVDLPTLDRKFDPASFTNENLGM
jgi:hypothetical protein